MPFCSHGLSHAIAAAARAEHCSHRLVTDVLQCFKLDGRLMGSKASRGDGWVD